MNNVLTLPTARRADAGRQHCQEPISAVAALVAQIDKALGDTWSFDLVHHEVIGDETIVFTMLMVDADTALASAVPA